MIILTFWIVKKLYACCLERYSCILQSYSYVNAWSKPQCLGSHIIEAEGLVALIPSVDLGKMASLVTIRSAMGDMLVFRDFDGDNVRVDPEHEVASQFGLKVGDFMIYEDSELSTSAESQGNKDEREWYLKFGTSYVSAQRHGHLKQCRQIRVVKYPSQLPGGVHAMLVRVFEIFHTLHRLTNRVNYGTIHLNQNCPNSGRTLEMILHQRRYLEQVHPISETVLVEIIPNVGGSLRSSDSIKCIQCQRGSSRW